MPEKNRLARLRLGMSSWREDHKKAQNLLAQDSAPRAPPQFPVSVESAVIEVRISGDTRIRGPEKRGTEISVRSGRKPLLRQRDLISYITIPAPCFQLPRPPLRQPSPGVLYE